jgi:hypothetical protein
VCAGFYAKSMPPELRQRHFAMKLIAAYTCIAWAAARFDT